MNDDLISRKELKRAIDDYAEKRKDILLWQSDVEDLIDNAPTVPLPDFKEGYKQAIIDGKTNFSRTREIELVKQLKLFKIAYLLVINEILPDINCDNCKYKNNKYCKTEDCHKAIYHYFLNRAKE